MTPLPGSGFRCGGGDRSGAPRALLRRGRSGRLWCSALLALTALCLVLAVSAAGQEAAPAPAPPSPSPSASPSSVREDWYRVEIAGKPAGWVRIREARQGAEITTETEMELSFKRGDTGVTVGLATRFVEAAAGEPISMWVSQATGEVPVETTYLFRPDHLEVRSVQGESTSTKTLPLPAGTWLPPAASQRRMREQLAAGADRYAYRTLDPATGPLPVDVVGTRTATGVEVTLPDGSTVRTSRWSQAQEPGPGVESVLYLDASGRLVKSVTPILGAEMVLLLAGEEAAKGDRREAPELLVRTFVRPSRPLPHPRRLRRAVYEVSVGQGEQPELPSAGGQRVERRGAAARVRVSTDGGGEDAATAPDAAAPYLEASSFLNHRDPAVQALAREALAEAGEAPAAQARALREFVHEYLDRKDLGTGFATASEVAVRKSGDCTEHSVLLAALLRSAGIPSRVVVGLLYVERFAGEREIFGYHMWTQALIDGRWVDYDALTPERFDAAHIALATSALGDQEGLLDVASAVAALVGKLEIRVISAGP